MLIVNFRYLFNRWLLILLLIGLVNIPAAMGPFLFDDFSNLDGLVGISQGTKTATDFVFEGTSGPTGRPVALASFLWPSGSFPDNALPFKLINIFIHLLNALLVYGIAKILLSSAGLNRQQVMLASSVAMLIWGIHPINQSAVFLVIQRMTLLMTFFTLSAIFVFIKYRNKLRAPIGSDSLMVVLGVGLLGVLSILSKEAGVILPVLLLVIQATIFTQNKAAKSSESNLISPYVNWIVIYLPSIIVCLAFLYWVIFRTSPEFINRDFNMYERALTQSRVVCDYLLQMFIPRLGGSGLFHDDYVISRSLWDPFSTILSMFFLIFLIVLASIKRVSWPVASFALFFYLAGHLIESTVLNLELYFEHRNYLPSVGLAIAAGYVVAKLNTKFRPLLIVYGALIVSLGAYNAYTWGSKQRIALSWGAENPNSVRAQVLLAGYWDQVGDYEEATESIKKAIQLKPFDGTLHVQLAVHKCFTNRSLVVTDFDELVQNIYKAQSYNHGLTGATGLMVDMLELDVCSGYSANDLITLFTYILNSKELVDTPSKYNLAFQVSKIYKINRDFPGYMNALEKNYIISPNLQIINLQLKTLLANGLSSEMSLYIDRGRELIQKNRESTVEIARFNVIVDEYNKTDINHTK